VKRIPESRINELVKELEQMLVDLQAEYDDDETDAESPDSHRPHSPLGGEGRAHPQTPLPFPLEEGKIQIPTSLVVVDETKKAKR